MVRINENYQKLRTNYLFSEIGQRTRNYIAQHPKAPVIRLGIGDTTQPLPPSIIKAFKDGIEEMADPTTYKGYGPEQGYPFLREAIAQYDYHKRGMQISPEEIFVSDGSKCDTGNILEIFGPNKIAITDPVYPVYVDTNVMAGNTGKSLPNGQYEGLIYLTCTEATEFKPIVPKYPVDLIYLCSPNNPTGIALNKEELTEWVSFAKKNKSIILFDGAYERYITESNIPRSIYEIEGAKDVAIEFRSFSKTAGFTGIRCAYTVVPKNLMAYDSKDTPISIHSLWMRRSTTKFNGVSYPVQKAAAAIYTPDGQRETQDVIHYYQENAKIIREGFILAKFTVFGGVNSPYIWIKTPKRMKSWEFFDLLLNELNIVGTPGSGFGPSGEGYFRLTSFGDRNKTIEAITRIKNYKW